MAEPEKPKPGRPESPTTARELDFDDDDVPASPHPNKTPSGTNSPAPKPGNGGGAATAVEAGDPNSPAQPPRPMSPREEAELTLREAFPSIDAGVVKAVLNASGGKVEPAFNALLGMTDPESQHEVPPPPPPRPASQTRAPVSRSQMEQDELYARQLAEHYQTQDARRESARQYREEQARRYREEEEPERSFIDDDLPEIGENIRKGFLETQTKVNSFFANLKKRFDEEMDDEPPPQPPRRPTQQQPGRRSGDSARRSSDRDRYDGDAAEIGDDFTALQLNDNDPPKRTSSRPQTNPNLFKPTPNPPTEERRRVSFQDGPPEEIGDDLYRHSPDPTNRPSSTTSSNNKGSKWQPLAAVDPSPVGDHDPFSLGDSDDDDKKKDNKPEDTERLKMAMAESMSDELGSGSNDKDKTGTMKLEEADTIGQKDKTAEEKLTGKS